MADKSRIIKRLTLLSINAVYFTLMTTELFLMMTLVWALTHHGHVPYIY